MIYNKAGASISNPYTLSGSIPNIAYNKAGEQIWAKFVPSHAVSNKFDMTLLYDIPDIGGGTQGLAVDNLSKNIAQLYTGKIITIDLTDGSYVQRASTRNLGHGGAGRFESEKKNPSDLYPALWVATQQNKTVDEDVYGQFLEVYIGESQSTINRAFFAKLPRNGSTLFAFDFDNNIAYCTIEASYYDETGWGGLIVAYDMTDVTQTTDITYAQNPTNGNWLLGDPLWVYETQYYREVQSSQFFDGLLCLLSDVHGVVFIDIETKQEYLRLGRDVIQNHELEGIDFLFNNQTQQYDMVISGRTTGINEYYLYQFNLSGG